MAHVQINDVLPEVTYTVGASAQSSFAFVFPFFDEDADIKVDVGGVTLSTGTYTVTGTAGSSRGYPGGTVVLNTAVTNTTVRVYRDTPVKRTTDLPSSGPLDIDSLNTDLDVHTNILREQENKLGTLESEVDDAAADAAAAAASAVTAANSASNADALLAMILALLDPSIGVDLSNFLEIGDDYILLKFKGTPFLKATINDDGSINFGHPTNFSTDVVSSPLFAIRGALDSAITGGGGGGDLHARNSFFTTFGDPVDVVLQTGGGNYTTPVPRDENSVGQETGKVYNRTLGPGSGGVYSFLGSYKTVRPIVLSGSPNFTGTRRMTGATQWIDGRRYHFLLTEASGSNPRVKINGYATWLDLCRADGSTPADDFWPAGTEITCVANTGANKLLADTESNSDRAEGREDDRRGGPFNGRGASYQFNMMGAASEVGRPTSAVILTCKPSDLLGTPRVAVTPIGAAVGFGLATREDFIDPDGVTDGDDYPSPLRPVTINGALQQYPALQHDELSWDKTFAWGPRCVRYEWGAGNFHATASDIAKWSGFAMRQSTDPRYGLDFGLDHTGHEFHFQTVQPGSSPVTITAYERSPDGYLRATAAGHGLRNLDEVQISGSDNSRLDRHHYTNKVDGDKFDLLGTKYASSVAAQGTITKVLRTVVGKISETTGALTWLANFLVGAAFKVVYSASDANGIQISGAATNGDPIIQPIGAEADIGVNFVAKGAAAIDMGTFRATQALLGAGGVEFIQYTVELNNVSGASVTATNLVPQNRRILQVLTRVNTALGTSNGTTGYTVGDGTDADRWGVATTTTLGTKTGGTTNPPTADPEQWSSSAQSPVITAVGGNFNGTGKIRVTAIIAVGVGATL